jgi:hypothetical protein
LEGAAVSVLRYKRYGRYGHYEVPMTYVVAADDAAYAGPVRGMKLGKIVNNSIHSYPRELWGLAVGLWYL